jgi:hypothetical protein
MKLYGRVSGSSKLNAKLSSTGNLAAKVVIGGGARYQGEYIVTSSTEEQTLATAQTYMESDVTIKAIPFSEVSNLAGGSTFFIGKEVDK